MRHRSRRRFAAVVTGAAVVLSGLGLGVVQAPPASAVTDRCAPTGNGWACSYNVRFNYYWCGPYYIPRTVRWQVPVGTPPTGGWPVAFYFAGTQPTDTSSAFNRSFGEPFGVEYEPQILHELLDDPAGTGKRYAVMVADPPASGGWVQAWHTNVVFPYTASCDYQFFPDFFNEIKGGSYGSASQYNMNKRYAYGISSGGFNSSRMAVTFNSGANANTWKALGILSASYATCSYTCNSVPTLPANHPPTKFWHGVNDSIVLISGMRNYYNKLVQGGFTTAKVEHPRGHEFTADDLGATGIKKWFDTF